MKDTTTVRNGFIGANLSNPLHLLPMCFYALKSGFLFAWFVENLYSYVQVEYVKHTGILCLCAVIRIRKYITNIERVFVDAFLTARVTSQELVLRIFVFFTSITSFIDYSAKSTVL